MQGRGNQSAQASFLMNGLREMLNPEHEVYRLSEAMPWEEFEREFSGMYSTTGRPAKPVRLMVGLLLLKQMYDLGDETVVEQWVQNPYWQFFCGEVEFRWELPCEPSDLVHFRKRIGEKGVLKILEGSIQMHGKKAQEEEILVDTTVQEKAETYPTDSKLHRKIAQTCWRIAREEGITLRRTFRKEVKQCVMAQRGRRHPKTMKLARRKAKRLKTIAGKILRDLERRLLNKKITKHQEKLGLCHRVLRQKKEQSDKVYSLHEPHIYCISKGKEHKKYEFGCKASVAMTKTSGILVGAFSLKQNQYDGHTLPEVLSQTKTLTGVIPKKVIADKGYRGARWIGETEILTPRKGPEDQSPKEKKAMQKRFRRRCAIEPVIGHLKSDFRMARNFLKGAIGDSINVMLAAAAWNFKKWMRLASLFVSFLQSLFQTLFLYQNFKKSF